MKSKLAIAKDIAKSKQGECLSDRFKGGSTKLKFECKEGHIWETSYESIRYASSWCPVCAKNKKASIHEMQELARKNNGKCLSDTYINSKTNLIWECEKGHIWYAYPYQIKKGSWCPFCQKKLGAAKRLHSLNDWTLEFVRKHSLGYYIWNINSKKVYIFGELSEYELINLLKDIEDCLLKKKKMTKLCQRTAIQNTVKLSTLFWEKLTREYLTHFAKLLTDQGNIIRLANLTELIYGIKGKTTLFLGSNKKFLYLVREIIKDEYNKQIELFPQRYNKVDIKKDYWTFFSLKENHLRPINFDFTQIESKGIRKEVKYYFADKLKYRNDYTNIRTPLFHLIRGLNHITSKYPDINYCADIKPIHITSLNNELQSNGKSKQGNKLSISTIADVFQQCKLLLEWLIYNSDKVPTKQPNHNHFELVTLHNTHNMHKSTEYIPDNVVEGLLEHIDDLEINCQRILLIMLNCGLRFKEVVYLEENCLESKVEDSTYILKYIPWKVLQSRRHHGLDDYHRIVIKQHVAEEISNQILETKWLRDYSNLKQIFIKKIGNYATKVLGSKYFNKTVNSLIKKRNICTVDNTLWHFTSKQCRKTLAVDMITNGAKPSEVSQYLGHNSEYTTNQYYNEVRKIKLADMNSDFFKKKFEIYVTEEQLSRYTEEERRILYTQFCLNQREVELGSCIKHMSEGPCNNRTGKINCATCSLLCTSVRDLPKWTALLNSQEAIISKILKVYKKEGITDYEIYREYQREMYLLNAYKEVVDKLIVKKGEDENDSK